MITFNVVKEQHGWAVRTGKAMTTPFWSREHAVREANCLADAIRFHGAVAEVVVDGSDPNEMPKKLAGASSAERRSFSPSRWPDAR
jgi:hypothetical protein